MTSLLDRAILLAVEAHSGQLDKAGEPYILHCLRVMCDPSLTSEEERTVGVLHDIKEDRPESWYDQREEFTPGVSDALDLLTRSEIEPYSDYIYRIAASGNLTAIKVKLADLRDNTSPFRQSTGALPPAQFRRYQNAKKVLSEAYNSLRTQAPEV